MSVKIPSTKTQTPNPRKCIGVQIPYCMFYNILSIKLSSIKGFHAFALGLKHSIIFSKYYLHMGRSKTLS